MRRSLALFAAVLLAAAACADRGAGKGFTAIGESPDPAGGGPRISLASGLRPFDSCGDLLDHVRTEAAARTGPFGLAGSGYRAGVVDAMPLAAPPAAGGMAARDVSGSEAAAGFSGTNIQEAGVDEADVVKTDGRRIFAVAQGRLQVLVVEDGHHRKAGSLLLPGGGPHDLLLAGDRVLVRSSSWGAGPPAGRPAAGMVVPGVGRTVFTLVDASDPSRPEVESTFEVDGTVLGARMVGDVARVVTASDPTGFSPVFPSDLRDEAGAAEANRAQVEASTLRNWLPVYRSGAAPGPERSGLLVDCERVSRPGRFSGLGTISVLTFDLARGLGDGDAVTVLADGQIVYASAEAVYVATVAHPEGTPLPDGAAPKARAPVQITTEIHKFDITGPGPARHVASGRVRGRLLNQFSMSEHDGRLRVATTDPAGPGGASESLVTVLEDRAGTLAAVGEVAGLGRGERIYAVRFLGEVGYVVTFREIDPLYTLDLSDPARPRMVGELKIPGYSAYLHPVGEGLLLGVGQDATETGVRTGAQVSLFDVSDPARPRRLDQVDLGTGSAAAEYDHHAFLWWAPRGLAVLPLQVWAPVPAGGAVGVSVEPGRGLTEIGRVTHGPVGVPSAAPAPAPFEEGPVLRSLVIGDRLFTFSEGGVLASSLADLSPRSWVGF